MSRAQMLALALIPMLAALALSAFAAEPGGSGDARVFELRTYIANEGKFEALQKRFREHTTALFKKHGMENIGYWTPQDEDRGKGHTLVYLLAFPSREAAKRSWAAFQADPEWRRVRDESERDGKLVKEVISVYLDPTDYSPMK